MLVRNADIWIIPQERLTAEERRKLHAKMNAKAVAQTKREEREKKAWKKKSGKAPFIGDK